MTGKAQLCRTKKIVASKLQKVLSETFLWKLNDLTMKYFNLRIIRLRCDQDSRLSQSRSAKLGPGPRVLSWWEWRRPSSSLTHCVVTITEKHKSTQYSIRDSRPCCRKVSSYRADSGLRVAFICLNENQGHCTLHCLGVFKYLNQYHCTGWRYLNI